MISTAHSSKAVAGRGFTQGVFLTKKITTSSVLNIKINTEGPLKGGISGCESLRVNKSLHHGAKSYISGKMSFRAEQRRSFSQRKHFLILTFALLNLLSLLLKPMPIFMKTKTRNFKNRFKPSMRKDKVSHNRRVLFQKEPTNHSIPSTNPPQPSSSLQTYQPQQTPTRLIH